MPPYRLFQQSSSFFANAALLVGGTGLSQLIIAGTAPLLTRLYSPREFGVYAVVLALVNFVAAIVCARYEVAVVLPRTNREAANLVALALLAAVAVSAGTAVVAFVAWLWFGAGQPRLFGLLAALLPLSALAAALQQILRSWLIRVHMFTAITVMMVIQAVVMVSLQLAAGAISGSSALYLVAASLIGTVMSVLCVAPSQMGQSVAGLRQAVSMKRIAFVARRYRRFPLYTAPYSLVSQLSQRGPIFLLAVLGSAAAIGSFALAQRTIYLPITVVVVSLSQAFFRRAAGNLHRRDVPELVRRVLVSSALVFGPLFAISAFNMPGIFAFVFGAQWRPAGEYGAWLACAAIMMFLTYWLDRVYDMLGRQRLALVMEASYNLVSLLLFALILHFERSVLLAVAAFSVVSAAYGIVYLAVTLRIARFDIRILGETVLALLAVAAYCGVLNFVLGKLFGYGVAYGVLLVLASLPPVVLGVLTAVQKIRLRPLGVPEATPPMPESSLAP